MTGSHILTTDFFADPRLNSITDSWLHSQRSPHTATAYRQDLRAWATWCDRNDLDPTAAQRTHADDYLHELARTPRPAARSLVRQEARAAKQDGRPPRKLAGRPLAPATIARRAAALSQWYDYLLDTQPPTTQSDPFKRARRPKPDRRHSATVSPSREDVIKLLLTARNQLTLNGDLTGGDGDTYLGPCAYPVVLMLVMLGARVSEVCQLDRSDRSGGGSTSVVILRGKGNQRRRRAAPEELDEAIDEYLHARRAADRVARRPTTEALFVDRDGTRLSRLQVYRLIRRLARLAGLPHSDRVTPHSLRHAFNTIAKEDGVPLEDRQDALGHADPRTTQLYDHARMSVLTDPSLRMGRALGLTRSRWASGA